MKELVLGVPVDLLYDHRTVIAASSAAVCSVVGGFPFDSVKTRMQTHAYRSMLDCVRQTYATEGIRGFFRGVLPPILTVSIVKSISFTIYTDSKTLLRRLFNTSERSMQELLLVSAASGAAAGSLVSLISCPLEIVKIQRQLEVMLKRSEALKAMQAAGPDRGKSMPVQVAGSLSIGVDILKKKGFLGLYRAFHLHVMRDFIGTGIYFATYEGFKRMLVSEGQVASTSTHLISGAMCGVASWVFIFPIDLVKSVVQKGVLSETRDARARAVAIAIEIWKRGGVRAFYSGFSSTLARAIPIHSLNWIVYEGVVARIDAMKGGANR